MYFENNTSTNSYKDREAKLITENHDPIIIFPAMLP